MATSIRRAAPVRISYSPCRRPLGFGLASMVVAQPDKSISGATGGLGWMPAQGRSSARVRHQLSDPIRFLSKESAIRTRCSSGRYPEPSAFRESRSVAISTLSKCHGRERRW
jgi:hypothetical protein